MKVAKLNFLLYVLLTIGSLSILFSCQKNSVQNRQEWLSGLSSRMNADPDFIAYRTTMKELRTKMLSGEIDLNQQNTDVFEKPGLTKEERLTICKGMDIKGCEYYLLLMEKIDLNTTRIKEKFPEYGSLSKEEKKEIIAVEAESYKAKAQN
jgi:hypothetical protein